MKVSELIKKLEKFDPNLDVYDNCGLLIEMVKEETWEHTNHPYNKPDKQIIVIY